MKKHALFVACLVLLSSAAIATAQVRKEIRFPNLPNHLTLKCDFHSHTVFSDGTVWPSVRVTEAWRQGLDATALTDHVEYQPHKDDLTTDLNRSYKLAADSARQYNLLFPQSAEITRDTPPGHFNAIFLENVEPLDTKEFVEAIRQANLQDAFVFWNHQAWKGSERGQWLDVHSTIYENQWLHGMEVANGGSYYPEAHQWCLDKNLTMLGNSDIHQPDLIVQNTADEHRTMTLVFAAQRSLPALKDALAKRQTVVWYEDQLIGRKEWLAPLFDASVQVAAPHRRSKDAVWVEIANLCEANIELERRGDVGPSKITLPANSTSLVKISTDTPDRELKLKYAATNLLVAPEKPLSVVLSIAR